MADAKIEQKVLTTPTFINGSLRMAGEVVSVDMSTFTDEDGNPADKKKMPNLANVGEAAVLVAAPVAAIAPTGPNPTQPQVVPAGSVQVSEGYVNGGALFVAEGSERAKQAAENDPNAGVEEEAVQRLNDTAQGAGTSGAGTNPLDRDGDGKSGGSKPAEPVSLSGKNKADLQQIAADEGADWNEDMTNAELTDAITAKRG